MNGNGSNGDDQQPAEQGRRTRRGFDFYEPFLAELGLEHTSRRARQTLFGRNGVVEGFIQHQDRRAEREHDDAEDEKKIARRNRRVVIAIGVAGILIPFLGTLGGNIVSRQQPQVVYVPQTPAPIPTASPIFTPR